MANDIQFYTNQTSGLASVSRLTIASNGNIGIGTTDTTNYKLNVAGSLNALSISSNGTLIDFTSYVTTDPQAVLPQR